MTRAWVIVASTRSAEGTAEDRTGPVIRDWLAERGFTVEKPRIVADGAPVGDALQQALASSPAVIITTGGTGVSPSDLTPEYVAPLLDLQLPGIIEAIRRAGVESMPTTIITRGVAGFAGGTFIVTLPGSPGGVRDGLHVLDPVLHHLLEQRSGGTRGQH